EPTAAQHETSSPMQRVNTLAMLFPFARRLSGDSCPCRRATWPRVRSRRQVVAILNAKDGGFDLPLDAVPRGGQAIDGDGTHAARSGLVSHHPGVEFSGLAGRKPEQKVEFTLGDGLGPVDPRVGDGEMTFVRRRSHEC